MDEPQKIEIEDIVQDTSAEGQTAAQIITKIIPDINKDPQLTPSQFINLYWRQYTEDYSSNSSLNGKVFEALIAISLIRSKVFPLYLQAHVTFIPGVDYDCIIYTEEIGPISLSAKTSLRERWKQADLEALALKNIHRNSKSYLISMSENEVRVRKKDPASVMALDGFVVANSDEFDNLINEIKKYKIIYAPEVVAVDSRIIITEDNHTNHF